MRILIVSSWAEDETIFRNILADLKCLEIFHYQDSQKGLAWAKENTFDLLIVSWDPDPMEGLSFIQQLQNQEPNQHPPILVIISSANPKMIAQLLPLEAVDFLYRPFEPQELSLRVKNMLRFREQQLKMIKQEMQIEKLIEDTIQQLRIGQERYELATLASNDGLWDWDLKQDRIYYSPRWCEMIGYRPEELMDFPYAWFNRIHPEDYDALRAAIQTHLMGQTESLNWEYRLRHRNGFYQWMHVRARVVCSPLGEPMRLIGVQTDITERKKLEQQLTYSAFHDTLTGLPNRSLLNERLQQAFARFKRDPQAQFAVLFLDLDKFKAVNDMYGHEGGDNLLQNVSKRIKQIVRDSDTPARLAGDEFIILLSETTSEEDTLAFAERLLADLNETVFEKYENFKPGISIGIALARPKDKDFIDVLRNADIALYKAKTKGRSCCVVYHDALRENPHSPLSQRAPLKDNILQAIHHGEFEVYYQPIYTLDQRILVGFEALLRWNHPRFGLIMPLDFLPEAEEKNSIQELGKFVIDTALFQLSEWQKTLSQQFFMSLNISGKQLFESSFIETLLYATKQHQVHASSVILEVTESSIMGSLEMAEIIASRLKENGFRMALDDYGALQSTFSCLIHMPFDYIKVDRSLVFNPHKKQTIQRAIKIIASLAKSLKVKLIYEGVELERDLRDLEGGEGYLAQGYYFARPESGRTLIETLGLKSAS